MSKKQRVKLRVDLTRYNPACKKGATGVTNPDDKNGWTTYPQFVKVQLDHGGPYFDALWKDLERIPEKVRKHKNEKTRRAA